MWKKLSIASTLLCVSSAALAGPDFSFVSGNPNNYISGIKGSGDHTYINGSSHGVDLNITAWSSALWGGNSYCIDDGQTSHAYDRCVSQSELTRYGSSGLGAINIDENDNTPNHSVDNNSLDYDMVLLSFSEEVNISNLYTGWNYTYKNLENNGSYSWRQSGTAGASAMAFTGTGFNESNPFSSKETWADTLADGWSIVNEDFKANGNNTTFNGKKLDILAVDSQIGTVYSKYWLVGAAHNVSRNAGNYTDHIKIAGVDFAKKPSNPTTGTPVNAPGTMAMFLSFAGFAAYRHKKNQQN